jgi:hypothetical protein
MQAVHAIKQSIFLDVYESDLSRIIKCDPIQSYEYYPKAGARSKLYSTTLPPRALVCSTFNTTQANSRYTAEAILTLRIYIWAQ